MKLKVVANNALNIFFKLFYIALKHITDSSSHKSKILSVIR